MDSKARGDPQRPMIESRDVRISMKSYVARVLLVTRARTRLRRGKRYAKSLETRLAVTDNGREFDPPSRDVG